jgi:hypothetical protein
VRLPRRYLDRFPNGHAPEPVSMWYFLAENPWYLAGAFGLVAVGFLIALKVTQNGRNLVRALIALGLAATVLVVEQFLVTDNERIEWQVKALIAALADSDATRMKALMDEHVIFSMRNATLGDELDLAWLTDRLKDLKFDWIHLSRLSTSAGDQTRRGSAEFKVGAAGTYTMGGIGHNFAGNSEWSLGFRKLPDGTWKISRITAQVFPQYVTLPMIQYRRRGPGFTPEPAPTPFDPRRGGRSGRIRD